MNLEIIEFEFKTNEKFATCGVILPELEIVIHDINISLSENHFCVNFPSNFNKELIKGSENLEKEICEKLEKQFPKIVS